MKNRFFLIGAIGLTFLFAGCSGLMELPMYWGNNAGSADIKPTGYHSDTKTGWMSYNDSVHIYFAFSFFDPRIQTMILRNGMTVFIDPSKRMKEDCYVRFPLIKREILAGVAEGQQIRQQQGRQRRNQRTTTQALMEQAESFELQWQNKKTILKVNPSLEKTDFKTFIAVDTAEVLNIIIGVPLNYIRPEGLSTMEDLVIGLRFGQAVADQYGSDRTQAIGNQQATSGTSAGISGGGGGGRGGRGGRGGGGGGGGGLSQPSSGQSAGNRGLNQGMDQPAPEFWYKTKLAKAHI